MGSFFYSNDESARVDTQARTSRVLGPVQVPDDAPVDLEGLTRSTPRRAEATPPSRFSSSPPVWRTWVVGFWRWLWDLEEPAQTLAPTSGLKGIKAEFNAALWDLQSLKANQVRDQIDAARSLRELWHLRADVFKVISTHRGQIEAQLRLDALDSHFPVRASRRSEDSRGAHVTTW